MSSFWGSKLLCMSLNVIAVQVWTLNLVGFLKKKHITRVLPWARGNVCGKKKIGIHQGLLSYFVSGQIDRQADRQIDRQTGVAKY